MVVSFDIYAVLTVIELIVCVVYLPFIFVRRVETWNKVLRLISTSVLLFINLAQIPMQIQMEKSYAMSIVLVVLWFINSLMNAFELGKDC